MAATNPFRISDLIAKYGWKFIPYAANLGPLLLAEAQVLFVDSGHTNASDADDTEHGHSFEKPLATIDYAIGLCTAAERSVILVAPGHNESLDESTIDFDVSDITCIGIGEGSNRPTIDFDSTDAQVIVGANNVHLINLRFRPSIDDIVIGVEVEAAVTGTILEKCEWAELENTGDEFVLGLDIKAGCTDTKVTNCLFRTEVDADGATHAIKLTGASDNVIIENSRFIGNWSTAAIGGDTTLSTDVLLDNLTIKTKDGEPGIEMLTGTTGIIRNVFIESTTGTVDSLIVADTMSWFNNYGAIGDGEAAELIGGGEVNAQIVAHGLDHMVTLADGNGQYPASVVQDSIIAMMLSKSANPVATSYDNRYESLEAIGDKAKDIRNLSYPDLGTVYYVDGFSGSNSNDGLSPETPVLTITYALSLVVNAANDYIVILAYYQAVGETWPIAVNKEKVHIVGPAVALKSGAYHHQWITPSGDNAAFEVTKSYVEIAGLDIAAGANHAGIEVPAAAGTIFGLCIHDCSFGDEQTAQDGIKFTEGSDAAETRIWGNYFGKGLTRDGVRLEASITRGHIGLIDRPCNIFREVPGIAIDVIKTGTDLGGICNNIIALPSDTAGKGITFPSVHNANCTVANNVFCFGAGELTTDPIADTASTKNNYVNNIGGPTPKAGAEGTTYFVDGFNGVNTNHGLTREKPLLTITEALSRVTNNNNDYIIILGYYQATGETWPIVVNKEKVHIISTGLLFQNQGGYQHNWIYPSGDKAAFEVTKSYVEIAGLDIAAGVSHAGIEIPASAGTIFGLCIHDCSFGDEQTAQDGIKFIEGSDAAETRIWGNFFGKGLTRDGIRLEASITRGHIGLFGKPRNIFREVAGIAIDVIKTGTDLGGICNNLISLPSNTAGKGITFPSVHNANCTVAGNDFCFGREALTVDPIADTASTKNNYVNNNGGLASFRTAVNPILGVRVQRAASEDVLDGNTTSLFTVSGGRVLITLLTMQNSVAACDSTANAVKLQHDPTTGTATDLCATLDVADDHINCLYTITGVASDALVQSGAATDGAVGSGMQAQVILDEGVLKVVSAGDSGSGGTDVQTSVDLWYIPLDEGAAVVTA